MNVTIADLRPTVIPKSDQLNADQLITGPMDIVVTDVRIGSSDEQPISVHYENEAGRPFKPCKTMRRVLILAWGPDGREWAGKSMRLFQDPSVRFGGAEVGGIRISHLSHIERRIQVSLSATKGKKAVHTIEVMEASRVPVNYTDALNAASTVTALKATFREAFRSSSNETVRAGFKATYDARLAELEKPAAISGAPTFDELTARLQKAKDQDEVNSIMSDAAELPPDEFDRVLAECKAWKPA